MKAIIYENVKLIWNYMKLNMTLEKADCIIGFGCYNDDIAIRAAELYHQNYAAKVLFTGALGRNTEEMWTIGEADRFARIAEKEGVRLQDIIIEDKATNTAENILFSKEKLANMSLPMNKIIGVHKPFMERRIYAALKVYWNEAEVFITSPQLSIEEYIKNSMKEGLSEKKIIDILVGDFQRIEVYAKLGYQIPQFIPIEVTQAFEFMVQEGYTSELV